MEHDALHVVVKLNPTLLGPADGAPPLQRAPRLPLPDSRHRLHQRPDLRAGVRADRPPRGGGEAHRPRAGGEVLQHPGGGERGRLSAQGREDLVPLGPAAARAGDDAGGALPRGVRRPAAGLVLRRHRQVQLPRRGRAGAQARHRLQRPLAHRRVRARPRVLRRARQAHGRGRGAQPRRAHLEGVRPGRGRAGEGARHRRRRVPAGARSRATRSRSRARSSSAGSREARLLNTRQYVARLPDDARYAVGAERQGAEQGRHAPWCCSTASPATSASRCVPTTPTSPTPCRRPSCRS